MENNNTNANANATVKPAAKAKSEGSGVELSPEMQAIMKELGTLTNQVSEMQQQLQETHTLSANTANTVKYMNHKERIDAANVDAENVTDTLKQEAAAAVEEQGIAGKVSGFVKRNWMRATIGTLSVAAVGASIYGVNKYRSSKVDQPLLSEVDTATGASDIPA